MSSSSAPSDGDRLRAYAASDADVECEAAEQQPPDPEPQEELLAPTEVATLYVRYADELRAFLWGVLRNHDLVEDTLQTTFIKLVEVGHKSHEETRKGWLFRVAFHEAILLKRKDSTRRKVFSLLAHSQGERGDVPEETLGRKELIERVRRTICELSAEQREVLYRRVYTEQTFASIAEELNIPLGTVLTRMRTALKRFQAIFPQDHD